jgi:hypothetical protein
MPPRSARYLLIQVRLGRDLAQYVEARRPGDGWRAIAADLSQVTGISVSHETLRAWFAESESAVA